MRSKFNIICAAATVAGLAGLAAPAFAQTVEELTVIGRLGPDGRPATLSRVVDIRDLDLRTDAGVAAMRTRVRDTARDICRELGETGGGSGLTRSCEDDAVSGAQAQMRLAINNARSGPALAVVTPPPAPYVAPTGETAPAADEASAPVSATAPAPTITTTTVTNGPVPDTPENRARFGGPMSRAGQRTAPAGN